MNRLQGSAVHLEMARTEMQSPVKQSPVKQSPVKPWRLLGGLVAALASCLPTESLSNYSNGVRPSEPAEALSESDPGGAAPTGVVVPEEPATPPASAAANPDCGGECPASVLSIEMDAGASVVVVDLERLQDAGVDATLGVPPADAAGDAATVCAPGALLGPGNRCFELVSVESSWTDARTRCQRRGAGWDLATAHDSERNAWLQSLLGTVSDVWLGASDAASEGLWRWVGDADPFWTGTGSTGSSLGAAYESWNRGGTAEPNGGETSDCLRLRAGGGWADLQCATALTSICEGPLN